MEDYLTQKSNTKKCSAGQMKGKNVSEKCRTEKLGMLGGDCLLYWKFLPGFGGWSRKPVVAWVWVLLFACVFFALLCARGARVSLTFSLARGSSLSCHLLSPRQALSQMTDFKWGCPEVSSAGYLHVFSALGSVSLLQH